MKQVSLLKRYVVPCSGRYRAPGGYLPPSTTWNGSQVSSITNFRTTGENIAGWKERLRLGMDATTYLYGYRSTFKHGFATYFSWNGLPSPAYGSVGSGGFFSLLNPGLLSLNRSLEQEAGSKASTKFAKKVRKRTQGWAGGVFAGELLETARLLASPVRTLRAGTLDLVSELLHRRMNRYKRLSWEKSDDRIKLGRMVTDTWLEWVYGIRPTINDCNDAANAFNRVAMGQHADRIRITAEGIAERSRQFNSNSWPLASTGTEVLKPGGTLRYQDLERATVVYRGVVSSRSPSGDQPLARQLGLGWEDLAPTAWELVPFSFLLDYFSNINDVLDVWSMRFIGFDWLNQTVRNSTERQFVHYDLSAPSKSGFVVVDRPESRIQDVERKSINNDQFMSGFVVRHPKWESTKWLNVSALAGSFLAGRRAFNANGY